MSRLTVLTDAAQMLATRLLIRIVGQGRRTPLPAWNLMFRQDVVASLRAEKHSIESFDIDLYTRLNSRRLLGQILFEYGVLANFIPTWNELSVLDIGSGASSFPSWMAFQGARVVRFDYPEPVEKLMDSRRARLNRWLRPRDVRVPEQVAGDMLVLPFRDESFDLVCSLSVIEHLDTEIRDRTYVSYPEQTRRARRALDEMVRVTRKGGVIYLTSDCCDFKRASVDYWRDSYYFKRSPSEAYPGFSSAWPVEQVLELFYAHLIGRGCRTVGPVDFDPEKLDGSDDVSTFRGPFFSAFSVLVKKDM